MSQQLNVVGLLSGGKDSCYNLCHCAALGHKVVALATLAPPKGKDELDSYMYQTVGHDAIHLIAEAMELPLFRTIITGRAINQTSTYGDRLPTQNPLQASTSSLTLSDDHDETEDLFTLLQNVKRSHPEINAVSVGAILSNYQRVRVEHVALRLGIQFLPLSFLWQRDQAELLDEMCKAEMQSILIKVAGAGLEMDDLGKSLKQMRTKLHRLNTLYGAHICGEGGEYETFTLDCPLFKKKIVLDQTTIITHGQESSDGVYYLKIDAAHLEEKSGQAQSLLANVTIPDRFDKFSARSRPKEVKQGLDLNAIKKIESVSLSQTPTVSYKSPWLSIGGVQGKAKGDGNIEIEFVEAFKTLKSILERHQLSLEHVAHLNIYLSNQTHFAILNSVYKTLFGVDPPSRACVAINMDEQNCNILIDGYAFSTSKRRKALHVQGRSYWASANIGPYSQAVEVEQRVSIAGQIGLDPPTLELVQDPFDQTVLALQHARRIFKAVLEPIRSDKKQGWIEGCVCWLNDTALVPFAQRLWLEQSECSTQDGDEDEDEEDDESDWESDWLGDKLEAIKIPIVYIVLAEDGLPRKAAIEWQLSAQTGDQVSTQNLGKVDIEDDNDDDTEKYNEPVMRQGIDSFSTMQLSWLSIKCKYSAAEFGIAYLYEQKNKEIGSTFVKDIFYSTGTQIRIFFTTQEMLSIIKDFIDHLSDHTKAAITFIPVFAIHDKQCSPVEAAMVWQTF